jgi:hypothetical protein
MRVVFIQVILLRLMQNDIYFLIISKYLEVLGYMLSSVSNKNGMRSSGRMSRSFPESTERQPSLLKQMESKIDIIMCNTTNNH